MYYKKIIFLLLWVSCVHARFATYEDARVAYEFYNRDIVVNLNGSSTETIEQEITILKDPARDEYGNYSIYYNADTSKLKLIAAKTIYQQQEHVVDKTMIVDKPVVTNTHGFDQMHRVLISYPKVEVGSKLYLKYTINIEKPPIDNAYTSSIYFGIAEYWKNSCINIKSALPLKILTNNPSDTLLVTHKKEKDLDILKLQLKKPCYYETVNENVSSYLENKYLTWVELSTITSMPKLGEKFVAGYEKRIQETLPPLFSNIVKDTNNITNEVEQINAVIIKLLESIRYVGDWRSVEGRLYPQPLQLVATRGFGDCKDFSVALASILRNLGYKTNAVLVYRSQQYLQENQELLPTINKFNHAIVKAQGKSGTIYWLDPTNFVSMANGIFPDIANRKVLVLDAKNTTYESIPNIDCNHANKLHDFQVAFSANDTLSSVGTITLQGETAIPLTGLSLTQSDKSIADNLINALSNDTIHLEKHIKLPSLKSRIVQNISIGYSFKVTNNTLLTALGNAYVIPTNSLVSDLISIPIDQVSATYLDIPSNLQKKILLVNADPNNIESLNASIDTKWMKASRTYSKTNSGVLLQENIKILTSFISNQDLKSQEFITMQNTLKKYFKGVAVVFKPLTK